MIKLTRTFSNRWLVPERELPLLPQRRPFRLWMTGSLALVMVSFASLPDLADAMDDERSSVVHVQRHSPFDVAETLSRIEATAAQRGLGVLARVGAERPVLVLASSIGATPAVMQEPGGLLHLPLSVQVRACGSGGAEVWIARACGEPEREWQGLPRAVLDDLAALPRWVDAALG